MELHRVGGGKGYGASVLAGFHRNLAVKRPRVSDAVQQLGTNVNKTPSPVIMCNLQRVSGHAVLHLL